MDPSVPPNHLPTVRLSSTNRPTHPLMHLSNRPMDAPVHFLTHVSPLPQPLPPAVSPGLPSPSRVSVHPGSQRPTLSLAGVGSFVPGPSPVALGHFMGIVPKRTLPAAFQILLPNRAQSSVCLFPRNLTWRRAQEAEANTGFWRDPPPGCWLAVSSTLVAGGEVTALATSGTPRLGWDTRGRKHTGWWPISRA